jgi:hypothetical protein
VSHFGRALQAFGLILLPAALLYGLTSKEPNAIQVEVACIALGALAFLIGTRLQRGR